MVVRRGMASSPDEAGGHGHALYESHVPTTMLQKLMVATRSAVGALREPERADLVASLGDATGHDALQRMRDRMRDSEVGRRILEERPLVTEGTIKIWELRQALPLIHDPNFGENARRGGGCADQHCRRMPEGTFGRAYADFMDSHGFVADDRARVQYVDDEELAYVMTRYREVHDFVHVLTGLGTTVEGEIVQKWLELLHTGLPVCLLSAVVGPLKLTPKQHLRLATEWVPWATRCAAHSPFMLNIYYEELFSEDLQGLRARFGIPPLPYGIPYESGAEGGSQTA